MGKIKQLIFAILLKLSIIKPVIKIHFLPGDNEA